MTYLIDSDYLIDSLKSQRDPIHILDSLVTDGLAISIITLAEVYEGMEYGKDRHI